MSKFSWLMMLLPHSIILYLLFYNMQSLTGKRQFFGVSFKEEYFNQNEFKLLEKEYKRFLSIGFLLIFLVSLFIIFILDKGSFAFTSFIILSIVYNFLVYVKIHSKTKELKNKLLDIHDDNDINLSSKSIIDVTFINERDKIIKKFKYIYLIPIFITLIVSIYVFSQYSSISDMIPNHWNFLGVADSFVKKSYLNIIGLISLQLGLSVLLSFISISSIKSRVRIDPENIEVSRSKNIKYLNQVGYTFFILILSTNLLISNTLLAFIYGPNLNVFASYIYMLITIGSIIYITYIYLKSPNSKSTSSYSPDDDENYWIWGMIYNNPNDPSFMVQKRFGIGWTINIAAPLGKVFLICTVLLFVFLIFDFIKSFFY